MANAYYELWSKLAASAIKKPQIKATV